MQATEERILDGAMKTAATEVLLPSEGGFIETDGNEKTYRLKQDTIVQQVDLNTAKNAINLQLTKFGPYRMNYSRNGRYMLFGGQKGHVAILDCQRTNLGAELQLHEEVHDVHFLHNPTLFAVAQNKYTYIYDHKGVEIHCMKKHERPYRLDFLPYHFLLTTIGHSGWIKWHDVSTGEYVGGYQTGHGPSRVLKHNPINAVSHVGHSNGKNSYYITIHVLIILYTFILLPIYTHISPTPFYFFFQGVVSLWSPASGKALVSMFVHKAPVADLAIDREGRLLVLILTPLNTPCDPRITSFFTVTSSLSRTRTNTLPLRTPWMHQESTWQLLEWIHW